MNKLRLLRYTFSRMKLRTQLFLTFLLSSVLLFGLSSAFLYINLLDLMQHRNEQATVGSFRQVERSITDFQLKTDSISKYYFLNSAFETFLNNTEKNKYEQLQLIRSILEKMTNDVSNNSFLNSIFIVTEDGKVIGVTSSASYVEVESKHRAFLDSDLHREASAGYPRLVWFGSGRYSDFESSVVSMKRPLKDVPIITASRAIRTFSQSETSGTLIINIQESSIYDNFGELRTLPGSKAFLLDARGVIISSSDKSLLGSHRPELTVMQGNYGSISTDANNHKQQFIYYRMKETGWLLCMEIPLTAFMADIYTLRSTFIIVLIICLAIGAIFSLWWTAKLTGPITHLIAGMRNLKQGHLGTIIKDQPSNELGIVIGEFNRMSQSINDLVMENSRIERGKKLAEIRVLQSQINPHFLFNTLNTIKWMAISIRANNIMETITALGNLIQPIYRNAVPIVSLREEFAYLQDYLKIMNNRYGEGITLLIQVDEDFMDLQVPRLIVQPVIENALLHGYEHCNYQGDIHIEGAREGTDVLLTIRDHGKGISDEKLAELSKKLDVPLSEEVEQESVGLVNVHQRLKLHYGIRYGIQIVSGETGTSVMLRFPDIPNS